MKLKVKAVIDDTLASLKASGQLAFDTVPNFNIEVPKNLEHGDWSCNVALTLAKVAGKKPPEVAQLIIKHLVDRSSIVVSVEKAGPGFSNFRLRDQVFQQIAREVLKAGATFGRLAPSLMEEGAGRVRLGEPHRPSAPGARAGRLHG